MAISSRDDEIGLDVLRKSNQHVASDGGVLKVVDARKGEAPDDVLHIPEPGQALPAPGTIVEAEIDWDYRYRLMRLHSCMHLVCSIVPGALSRWC